MASGRPSKYSEEIQSLADRYVKDCQEVDEKQIIPTVAGLAAVVGVCKATIYNWAKENTKLLDTLAELQGKQELSLVNNGLSSTYNASITKLMLCNHGYSDTPQAPQGQTPIINIINPYGDDKTN